MSCYAIALHFGSFSPLPPFLQWFIETDGIFWDSDVFSVIQVDDFILVVFQWWLSATLECCVASLNNCTPSETQSLFQRKGEMSLCNRMRQFIEI